MNAGWIAFCIIMSYILLLCFIVYVGINLKTNKVMKELSIEEKAKAYDEAYKVAKNIHIFSSDLAEIKRMEEIFPELKEESEGERIRKRICKLLWDNVPYEEAQEYVAWLEKQNEQKPVIEMKTPEESLGIDSNTYNKIVDECIYGEQKHTDKSEPTDYNSIDPHFGKPIDKVEPKFKIEKDKWYVCIRNLDDNYGTRAFYKGDIYHSTKDETLMPVNSNVPYEIKYCAEDYFRLWTIQDAKDGDVLAFDDETIVIFKDLYNSTTFHSYCHIEEGTFSVSQDDMPDWWEGEGFHPATKEQRDQLEKAMADAGYTFDFEKKELKKIEQKSAWSEEDELMLVSIIQTLKLTNGSAQMKIDWLKSLKERVENEKDKHQ